MVSLLETCLKIGVIPGAEGSGWTVIQTNPVRHNRECGEDANLDCCQRLRFGSDCHDSYGVTIYSIILPNFSF